MTTGKVINEKSCAGNPYVRFDARAMPLLYKAIVITVIGIVVALAGCQCTTVSESYTVDKVEEANSLHYQNVSDLNSLTEYSTGAIPAVVSTSKIDERKVYRPNGIHILFFLCTLGLVPDWDTYESQWHVDVITPIGRKSGDFVRTRREFWGWVPYLLPFASSDPDTRTGEVTYELAQRVVAQFKSGWTKERVDSLNAAEKERVNAKRKQADELLAAKNWSAVLPLCEGEKDGNYVTEYRDKAESCRISVKRETAESALKNKEWQRVLDLCKDEKDKGFVDEYSKKIDDEENKCLACVKKDLQTLLTKNEFEKAKKLHIAEYSQWEKVDGCNTAAWNSLRDMIAKGKEEFVGQMNDMSALEKIANNKDETWTIRKVADERWISLKKVEVENTSDQGVLAQVAQTEGEDMELRKMAVERLTDQTALMQIVISDGLSDKLPWDVIREMATRKLTDESIRKLIEHVDKLTPEMRTIIKGKAISPEILEALLQADVEMTVNNLHRGYHTENIKNLFSCLVVRSDGSCHFIYPRIHDDIERIKDPTVRAEVAKRLLEEHIELNGGTIHIDSRYANKVREGARYYEHQFDGVTNYISFLNQECARKLLSVSDFKVGGTHEGYIWYAKALVKKLPPKDIKTIMTNIVTRCMSEPRIHFEGFYPGMPIRDFCVLCALTNVAPRFYLQDEQKVRWIRFERLDRYALFEKEDVEFWYAFLNKYVPGEKSRLFHRDQNGIDVYVYKSIKYHTVVKYWEDSGRLELESYHP